MKKAAGSAGDASRESAHPYRLVTVLSVSALEEDHIQLRLLFHHTKWALLEAGSCREALALLRRHAVPVVITDHLLPDGTWKDLLREAESVPSRPCLMVASRLADEHLWTEVLDQGGFNVLEKPFDGNELFRLVSLAWLNWRERADLSRRAASAAG